MSTGQSLFDKYQRPETNALLNPEDGFKVNATKPAPKATNLGNKPEPAPAVNYNGYRPPVQAVPDINQILQSLGVGGDAGAVDPVAEAQRMVEAQFGPQLQAIAQQEANAGQRFNQGDAAIQQMYAALKSSIEGDAPKVAANFDQGLAAVDTAFDQGTASVQNAYGKSDARMQALAKQLGMEGVPDSARQQSEQQAFMESLLAASRGGFEGALNTSKAGALQYNTANAQAAGFAGNEQRGLLRRQFEDLLSNLGSQRLGIMGEMGGRRGDLEMAFDDRNYQREQDAWGRDMQLAEMQMQAMDRNAQAASGANQKLSTWEQTYQKAMEMFGSPEEAERAMALMRSVAYESGMGNDPMAFAELVGAANRGTGLNSFMMTNLATDFWQGLKPRSPDMLTQLGQ